MMYRAVLLMLLAFQLGLSAQEKPDSTLQFEVYFELDEHRMNAYSRSVIDSILERVPIALIQELRIYGHTDSLADTSYNRALSRRRVISTLEYLVLQGVDPLLVKTDYYGEGRPKYDNGPEQRFRNRRCEVEMDIAQALLPEPEQKLSELDLKRGDRLRIPNLNFVGNQPIPTWESMEALQEILRLLQRNPDMQVEIQGHVCCAGDQELSELRAATVYQFLLVNGIAEKRMRAVGYSNKRPMVREVDEASRAQNRRVELQILENSTLRQEVPNAKSIVDLRTPVLNMRFFEGAARLMPSGDFGLELIADMLAESKAYYYHFIVYDNIGNPSLSRQRAVSLERVLKRKGVRADIFDVEVAEWPREGLTSDKNQIILEIRSR